jgi:two-component system, OmpR family, response regulator
MTLLPKTLALIEDNLEFATFVGDYLRALGVAVTVYRDSDDFLQSPLAYSFDFYLVDLQLPGVSGLDVVRLLRRRVPVGIVVITGREGGDVVDAVLDAGADMYLLKPSTAEQLGIVVKAVHRRTRRSVALSATWRLDRRARTLTTPSGKSLLLGETDLVVMNCFVGNAAKTVSHAELCRELGRETTQEAANWLHATIYRLRRRVEAAGAEHLPLNSQARVGYVFRGPLMAD